MRWTGNSPPPRTGTVAAGTGVMTRLIAAGLLANGWAGMRPGARPLPPQPMFEPRRIKHCRVCGQPTAYLVPADDNRERAVCAACGEIHYENPINVVGTVPAWDDQVLLCRR